jgi:EmrB/QacA subfamily drug resistance transporter
MPGTTIHAETVRGAGDRHVAVTAVVCLALAAVVAAMASLNVALPSIARSTHASQTQLEWVIDAYSLAFASLLLPAGAIGDRYGRRRALLIGLTVFGGGSVIAMLAASADMLIVLRGVLGVGAALVMPATLSTITSTFPPRQRTKAVGVWAAVAGASALLGLLISGALLAAFSWQAVFGSNVVLASIALIGTARFVPESANPDAPKLDFVGAIIAVLGLVAVVFSVIEAPTAGWLSTQTLIGVGAGLAMLAGFVAWELRHPHPLLDPRVFRSPRLAAGSVSIFIQFFAFFGFAFIVLQYLQIIRGHSPILAAVSMLPLSASLVLTSRRAPILAARFGARAVCTAGLVLIAAGMIVLAQMGAQTSYLLQLAGIVPLGVGMGLAMTPATSGITEALPDAEQGVGSALNDLSRELAARSGSRSSAAYSQPPIAATFTSQAYPPPWAARHAHPWPSPPTSAGRRPPTHTPPSSPGCTSRCSAPRSRSPSRPSSSPRYSPHAASAPPPHRPRSRPHDPARPYAPPHPTASSRNTTTQHPPARPATRSVTANRPCRSATPPNAFDSAALETPPRSAPSFTFPLGFASPPAAGR